MKKILFLMLAAIAVIFCSCRTRKYVISEGDGVFGYYIFDDGLSDGVVIDHSGMSRDIETGCGKESQITAGRNGNALLFNGESEYLEIDGDLFQEDGFTFSAWLKPTVWRDWARVFDFGNAGACDVWCGMDYNTKLLRMDVFGRSGGVSILAPLPPIGEWTNVSAVFGNGKVALYVNGDLAQELPCSVTMEELGTSSTFYVGRSNWDSDPFFSGAMDEILIANRTFTPAELKQVARGVNGW